MRYIALTLFLIAIFLKSFTQTTTVDYQLWNINNPPCNLFGTLANVPAIVNNVNGSLGHLTNIGQPRLVVSSNIRQVELDCAISSGGVYTGTQYQINYSFQSGYSYAIKINAAASSSGTNPNLVVKITNGANGGNTSCNGMGGISSNLSGDLSGSASISTNGVYTDYFYSPFQVVTQGLTSIVSIPKKQTV